MTFSGRYTIRSGRTIANTSNLLGAPLLVTSVLVVLFSYPVRTSTRNSWPSRSIAKSQLQDGLIARNTSYPNAKRSTQTRNSFIAPTVPGAKPGWALLTPYLWAYRILRHRLLQNFVWVWYFSGSDFWHTIHSRISDIKSSS